MGNKKDHLDVSLEKWLNQLSGDVVVDAWGSKGIVGTIYKHDSELEPIDARDLKIHHLVKVGSFRYRDLLDRGFSDEAIRLVDELHGLYTQFGKENVIHEGTYLDTDGKRQLNYSFVTGFEYPMESYRMDIIDLSNGAVQTPNIQKIRKP